MRRNSKGLDGEMRRGAFAGSAVVALPPYYMQMQMQMPQMQQMQIVVGVPSSMQ